MSLSMITAVLAQAAEESSESGPPVPAVVVGVIAFGILMALLVALVTFGGGREHS